MRKCDDVKLAFLFGGGNQIVHRTEISQGSALRTFINLHALPEVESAEESVLPDPQAAMEKPERQQESRQPVCAEKSWKSISFLCLVHNNKKEDKPSNQRDTDLTVNMQFILNRKN